MQVHNQSESFTVSEAGLAGGGEPVVKVSDKTLWDHIWRSRVHARSQGGRRLHDGLGGNPVRHHEHRGQLKAGGRLDARSCHTLTWHLETFPTGQAPVLTGCVARCSARWPPRPRAPTPPRTARSTATSGRWRSGLFRQLPRAKYRVSPKKWLSEWSLSHGAGAQSAVTGTPLNRTWTGLCLEKKFLVSFLTEIKRFQAMSMGKFGQTAPNFGLDYSASAAFWKSCTFPREPQRTWPFFLSRLHFDSDEAGDGSLEKVHLFKNKCAS